MTTKNNLCFSPTSYVWAKCRRDDVNESGSNEAWVEPIGGWLRLDDPTQKITQRESLDAATSFAFRKQISSHVERLSLVGGNFFLPVNLFVDFTEFISILNVNKILTNNKLV